ncbi:uncharacterized protein LOC143899937 isoform X2 [Temnothorax americanus]|uniref:uncharacterized protein LOC143899937 isoform X2 n=1 Tax=Temnothorax americanus TaxID=1964332 RepID=UPI0040690C6F
MHALSVGIASASYRINDVIIRTARATKPRRWQFAGNSRETGPAANICAGGLFNGPGDNTTKTICLRNQSGLRCLRSSTSLNRTPGNPTCHVATVLQKMIGSIVLALLLFCQSINNGRCLRANGTHDEISEAARRHRLRRSLTFPDPSMLLLILGLGTPLQLDRESVIVGVFAKMQYAMPTNATDFTEPGVYYTRASKSRWSFYRMFEKVATLYGFGGKECLLKAICEVAYVPFDVHHGLLGQLVQTFLRCKEENKSGYCN